MIRPINVGETIEYTLPGDTEDPTTFIIGILDSILKSKLKDLGMVYRYNPDAPKDSVAECHMNIGEQDLEFVRFGLRGFKNFKDKKGNDIQFKTTKRKIANTEYDIVSDETLGHIPIEAITKLAKKIAEENVLSEKETKN